LEWTNTPSIGCPLYDSIMDEPQLVGAGWFTLARSRSNRGAAVGNGVCWICGEKEKFSKLWFFWHYSVCFNYCLLELLFAINCEVLETPLTLPRRRHRINSELPLWCHLSYEAHNNFTSYGPRKASSPSLHKGCLRIQGIMLLLFYYLCYSYGRTQAVAAAAARTNHGLIINLFFGFQNSRPKIWPATIPFLDYWLPLTPSYCTGEPTRLQPSSMSCL
jgi:hypothetical protein